MHVCFLTLLLRLLLMCCAAVQTDINDNPPDPARPISASQLAPRGKVRGTQQRTACAPNAHGMLQLSALVPAEYAGNNRQLLLGVATSDGCRIGASRLHAL
jgi:hypothetical protein